MPERIHPPPLPAKPSPWATVCQAAISAWGRFRGLPARSQAWIAAGVLVLLVILGAIVPEPQPRGGEAWTAAKGFVVEYLKAPDTADFGRNYKATLGKDKAGRPLWIVTGTVTAKNAFGVPIRTQFKCGMWWHERKWVLQSMEID